MEVGFWDDKKGNGAQSPVRMLFLKNDTEGEYHHDF